MIIPCILFARMRARNKGRTAKLSRLLALTATVFCLTLVIPTTARAQWTSQSEFGSSRKQGHGTKWGFSHSGNESSPTTRNSCSPNSYTSDDLLGYWFKSIQWLGISSEEAFFSSDFEGANSSREEDINLFPLAGLLMFRYPTGPFQSYLGIGPTLLSTSDGLEQMNILDSVFLGSSYTF